MMEPPVDETFDDMFGSFGTVYVCDRQTDRRTDRMAPNIALHMMRRTVKTSVLLRSIGIC